MKLSVLPPQRALHRLELTPGAPMPPGAGSTPTDPPGPARERPLDLAATFEFGDSSIDEAAVVLVELSTLVYGKLPEVLSAVDPTPLRHVTLLDSQGPRDADVARWRTLRRPVMSGMLDWRLGAQLPTPAFRLEDTVAWKAMSAGALATPPSLAAPSAPAVPSPPSDPAWPRPARVLAATHQGCALVVFRGTQGGRDFLTDAMCWPALRWPLRHAGFERTWQALRPHLSAWLARVESETGPRPTLYLGGHSLGGALATLAAFDLAAEGYPVARVVTMGSPRVGGWLHRRRYRAQSAAPATDGAARRLHEVTTRFVHGTDIVAAVLPPPLVAAHTTDAFALKPKDRLDLTEYLPSPNPIDPSALVRPWVGSAGHGVWASGAVVDQGERRKRLRRAVSEVAKWILLSAEASPLLKVLSIAAPLATEVLIRSGMAHRSQRYLGFMPPSALHRAMFARTGVDEEPRAAAPAARG